jgi:polyisoprenoid-binding protein YceI
MKKRLLYFLLWINAGFALQAQSPELNFYRADTLSSNLSWKCDKHNGTVKLRDGGFILEAENIVAGKFIIDMKTIKDSDMDPKQFGTAVLILENTIKNEFFEVEKYPYAIFDLVSVKHLQANEFELTGDFTMHGNKICLSFKAEIKQDAHDMTFKSERFAIDRTDWGVYRMSPKRPYSDDENGWTVPDKVEIQINLKLQKE